MQTIGVERISFLSYGIVRRRSGRVCMLDEEGWWCRVGEGCSRHQYRLVRFITRKRADQYLATMTLTWLAEDIC